ncbi:hypothetical protein BDV96DRAFT_608021 [Lophiotrema nucula]|uniref:Uncharacterized protein n=1 Tax=Lophiotrema nucula TaxID=690887 RepID=A0A6A5YFP2_9PLEO|nr:hypothetical protein BDV96DRAFT_608021 [Lophiotrema nucula]
MWRLAHLTAGNNVQQEAVRLVYDVSMTQVQGSSRWMKAVLLTNDTDDLIKEEIEEYMDGLEKLKETDKNFSSECVLSAWTVSSLVNRHIAWLERLARPYFATHDPRNVGNVFPKIAASLYTAMHKQQYSCPRHIMEGFQDTSHIGTFYHSGWPGMQAVATQKPSKAHLRYVVLLDVGPLWALEAVVMNVFASRQLRSETSVQANAAEIGRPFRPPLLRLRNDVHPQNISLEATDLPVALKFNLKRMSSRFLGGHYQHEVLIDLCGSQVRQTLFIFGNGKSGKGVTERLYVAISASIESTPVIPQPQRNYYQDLTSVLRRDPFQQL